MLEHSQNNYGPLPSELRPRRIRSRTSSRASPYPARIVKASMSPDQHRASHYEDMYQEANISKPFASPVREPQPVPVLQQITVNPNITIVSPPPILDVKPFSPFAVEVQKPAFDSYKNSLGLPIPARPRVTSNARRSALGWSKRSSGKSSSSDHKENSTQGILTTPSETLRISRPRPRGRPTPARSPAIRV